MSGSGQNLKNDPGFYKEQPTFSNNQQQVNRLKRTMTLDLNSASKAPALKRNKLALTQSPAVLSSPDLHMLKLASPELERFIMQGNNLATPTPSLFTRSVTAEQEIFSQGFEDALNVLHNSDSSQMEPGAGGQGAGPSASSPSSALTYTNLEPQQQSNSSLTSLPGISPGSGFNGLQSSCSDTTSSGASSPVGGHYGSSMSPGYLGVRIKDEPQTVPSVGGNSPPMSPIDMENQEKIKLERKRQRNRIAASKCRRRKLERISKLEDKVKILKNENSELSTVVNKLKDQVCHLKEQVMDHVHSGCQILQGVSPTTLAY